MESERFNCNNVNYRKFCVDDDVSFSCNGISHRKTPFRVPTADIYSVGSIDHPVSRFDTLAGVAIKYGVEVADIKKMNGLVSDLQMFAHKSIQIPLPGRHPPSPALSNGSDTSRNEEPDTSESFQSFKLSSSKPKVSPAMCSLQGYYGLDTASNRVSTTSSISSSSHHRKSRSLVDCFIDDKTIIEESRDETEKKDEKLVRRRQKSEADFTKSYACIPIWDDTTGSSSTAITGKNLALRSKASNRVDPGFSPAPNGSTWESLESGGCSSVRRSSSTSNLHDQDSNGLSLWSNSMWNLKPDLQILSPAASIARPIFDGLPKPITSRKNKTALD